MEKYIEQLSSLPIFYKVEKSNIQKLCNCLGASVRSYHTGEYILHEHEEVSKIYIVLEGEVLLFKEDIDNGRSLVGKLREGQVLGESYIGRTPIASQLSATAARRCVIFSVPCRRLLFECNLQCRFHHRMVENLVITISESNRRLSEKITVLSKKTIRERLLCYLRLESEKSGSPTFQIPFNRTELSNYLCTDRSALAREIGNLKKEGLLSCDKNTFTLHSVAASPTGRSAQNAESASPHKS